MKKIRIILLIIGGKEVIPILDWGENVYVEKEDLIFDDEAYKLEMWCKKHHIKYKAKEIYVSI